LFFAGCCTKRASPEFQLQAIRNPLQGNCLMAEERRRHFRKASLIPVAYATEGKSRKDHILNISSGGVFIGTQDETSCGSEILMSFVHPDARRDLSIVGRIAWVSSDGIGVRFKRLAEKGTESFMGADMKDSQSEEKNEEVKTMGKIRKKRIRWESSMTDDVVKYRLYWSENGMVSETSKYVDVGNVTEIVIPDDVPSFPLIRGNMAFGIAALTEAGNESDMTKMTAEIDFVLPDAPTNLMIEDV
jgi:Tfp pilus assembly protein PilZ